MPNGRPARVRINADHLKILRDVFKQALRCLAWCDPNPLGKPGQYRKTFQNRVCRHDKIIILLFEPFQSRQRGFVMFVPRRYQRHQATGIYADVHLVSRPRSLRVSSIIFRTRSAVKAGVPEGALATTNEPLRTHLTFLYTGSICTLPSQY